MSRMRMATCLVAFSACGRLDFDKRDASITGGDSGGPDALVRCPDSLFCDDFDDDAWNPWLLRTDMGTAMVTAGCGTNGSRCLRTSAIGGNAAARFEVTQLGDFTRLELVATITVRQTAGAGGYAQLLAFDLGPGNTTSASDQVGVETSAIGLTTYDYSFITLQAARTQGGPQLALDVPARIALVFDLVANELAVSVNGGALQLQHTPMSTLGTSHCNALVGLYTDEAGWIVDFDDVLVRGEP